MTKLTIIETGLPPEPIRDRHDRYPDMFERLLSPALPEAHYEHVSVVTGAALPDPAALDAILITGSPFGVYDTPDWMRPLKEWIGFAAEAQTPMVGICFGHQVIADALGGDVRKSDKGWGIGRHAYTLCEEREWMTEPADGFSLAVSHQDQVIAPPPTARTFAQSDFCEHAGLYYTHAPIISFQGHPEFENAFASDLYNARRNQPLTDEQADEAIDSLSRPHNNDLVSQWIGHFLKAETS